MSHIKVKKQQDLCALCGPLLGSATLVSQLGGAKLTLKSECWEDESGTGHLSGAFLAHLSVTKGVMWQDGVSILLSEVPLLRELLNQLEDPTLLTSSNLTFSTSECQQAKVWQLAHEF